jgi:hypothetical protein
VNRAPVLAAGILLSLSAAFLSGCGGDSDSSPSTSSSASAEPSFDPAKATLTDSSFCDRLDATKAATALGLSGVQLKLVANRKEGDKFDTPFSDKKETSTSNTCAYADSANTGFFNVAVDPTSSAKEVTNVIQRLEKSDGNKDSSDKCDVTRETTFGDPGSVALCEGNFDFNRGLSKVQVDGLVGTSRFFCQGGVQKGTTPQALDKPVRDLCSAVLKQLVEK